MSDTRRVTSDPMRVRSDPKRGVYAMSSAAAEAFKFLNVLTQRHYRGFGDTPSAARDRAAKDAGISTAQAERVWKRWQEMKTVNGDVYRALRNAYEAACSHNEKAADDLFERRQTLRETNAAHQKHASENASQIDAFL